MSATPTPEPAWPSLLNPNHSRIGALAPWNLKLLGLLLFVGTAALYGAIACCPGLLDQADASHAIVSREMVERGDYAVMYLNGIRYLMKAPLQYWMVAANYAVFGQSELATRAPTVLAMALLALVLFEFARHFFGTRAGLCSAAVMVTSVGSFMFTRIMIPEPIYALLFALTFYIFLRSWFGTLDVRRASYMIAALCALSVLARGLIGIVFPVGIMVVFIVLDGGWRRIREYVNFGSIGVFLIIAVPWHLLAELRAPGFAWSYFINEHFNRALGTRYPPDYDAVPLATWLLAHLVWFFPWSVFVPALVLGLKDRWFRRERSAQSRAVVFLLVWAGFILGFFSLISGSRMEYYGFGAFPAIALLLGVGLAWADEERQRMVRVLYGALAVVGVAAAAVLGYMVWQSWGITPQGDISQLLEQRELDAYRVSMAHMLDLTGQAFAFLRAPATLAAFALGVFLPAAWLARMRGGRGAAVGLTSAGMVAFFAAATLALTVFEPHLSSKPLAVEINRVTTPQSVVAVYGEFDLTSSVGFYTRRRVLIYNGRYNNLEAGSRYPDAPRIFLEDADFQALWNSGQHVVIAIPRELREQGEARMATLPRWVAAEAGGKIVYSNRPL